MYWIDGELTDGVWKYSDGRNISYFFWGGSEPGGGANEPCLDLIREWSFDMNDASCSYSDVNYICEINMSG
jgi:hypothetical protein